MLNPDPQILACRFQPWIGSQYYSGLRGKKVLLLGESHYGEGNGYGPEFTRGVVRQEALQGRGSFFTKIYKLCCGTSRQDRTPEDFWNSVAFYNYVQTLVGNGPRARPTADDWKTGEGPFLEVLGTLRPDRVLVLGKELWYQLPTSSGSRMIAVGASEIEIRSYNSSDHTTQAAMVHHPSSFGFSCEDWLPVVQALFEQPR